MTAHAALVTLKFMFDNERMSERSRVLLVEANTGIWL
jgi:hypothetical protein